MKVYRKKPVEVEAVEWTGSNLDEILEWAGNAVSVHPGNDTELSVVTNHGSTTASAGDYIIKSPADEFYPCTKEVFVATYDVVEEQ